MFRHLCAGALRAIGYRVRVVFPSFFPAFQEISCLSAVSDLTSFQIGFLLLYVQSSQSMMPLAHISLATVGMSFNLGFLPLLPCSIERILAFTRFIILLLFRTIYTRPGHCSKEAHRINIRYMTNAKESARARTGGYKTSLVLYMSWIRSTQRWRWGVDQRRLQY